MCGIIGGYNIDNIDASLYSIIHRGRDASGVAQVGSVSFGHVRLSIIDVSSLSNQPFVVGDTTLVFNGTIWNYQDVREYLIKEYGVTFKTTGDVEVITNLIDREDYHGLNRLQGMFAVAWTKGNDDIHLARDRFGEVPLHYSLLDASIFPEFYFCSEIKGLLSLGVNMQNIKMLRPGGYLKVVNNEKIVDTLWYDIDENIKFLDYDNRDIASDTIRSLVERGSVERTVSDVPVCTLLSGGIDSSAITYHVSKEIPDLVSYIAVFDEKSRDLRCAREVAEMLDIDLIEVKVQPPTVSDIEGIINTIEMKYKAQIEISWGCIKLAERISSDGFKVVLSGEGSDELWASYGMDYHGIETHGWTEYRKNKFGSQERKNFARVNKIFMKYGIESRLPFLNTELVETALGMKQDMVWNGKRNPKAVLQSGYKSVLPDEITTRQKVAFQDGMGIKNEFERVLDKPPIIWYKERYDKTFNI